MSEPSILYKSLKKTLALGDPQLASMFKMTCLDPKYSDIEYLVESISTPEVGREQLEDYTQYGVKIFHQAELKNAGESPITFKEKISGKAFDFLVDIVNEKKYLDWQLTPLTGDSQKPEGKPWYFYHCFINIDATEFSKESVATNLKPTGTLIYNFYSYGEPL